MGFFDSMKAKQLGMKAYRLHVSAQQLRSSGKYQEAQAKLDEAFVLYGQSYEGGYRRSSVVLAYAILTMQRGDFARARELMLEANKDKTMSKDDRFTLRVNYSICQWKLGQLDKAIETIQTAANVKKNSLIYTTLGMYYVDKARATGAFEEALAFNQEAMDYDDEDASTLDNMAQLYMLMAEKAEGEQRAEYRKKAFEYIKKAYELKPEQMTSVYYYAKMSHENGDDATARKVLEKSEQIPVTALCPISKEDLLALEREVQ